MRGPDRLVRFRLVGLAGTTLMAAGAYGAGALPGSDPVAQLSAASLMERPWAYQLGLAAWLAGMVALAVVWWRLGTTLRRGDPPVARRWLLVTGALWAAPLLLAPPLGSRDVYAYACQGVLWLGGDDPYTVGVDAGGCPWLAAVPPLWQDTPTPYGPLALALSGGIVVIARALPATEYGQLLVAVSLFRTVALGGGALVAICAPRLARACRVDPVSATWLGVVSPLVAVHVVSGAHNDALMAGLVVVAVASSTAPASSTASASAITPAASTVPAASTAPAGSTGSEPRPDAPRPDGPGRHRSPPDRREAMVRALLPCLGAGAVLGLAVAVKVTAVVAVPFVILLTARKIRVIRGLAWRHTGDSQELSPDHRGVGWAAAGVVGAGAGVVGAGVVVFAGLTAVTGLDLGWIGALSNTGRLVQWTSIPSGLGMAAGYLLRVMGRPESFDGAVAVARLVGLLALAAAGAALYVRAWRARHRPPSAANRIIVTSCGGAFAALAVLSPVFYPWYALTAVALLAASSADPRVRRGLAVAVLVLSFLVLPDGLGLAVLTKLPGALLDVALVGTGAVALAVLARRRVTRRRVTRWQATPHPARPDAARPDAARPDAARRRTAGNP